MLTQKELDNLKLDWFKGDKTIRFGQLFCNEHMVSNQYLFYENDFNAAYSHIQQNYVVDSYPIVPEEDDDDEEEELETPVHKQAE